MSLVAVKPGGWDTEEVLTSDDLNALQAEYIKAIDGTGGGFYTIIADLEIVGAAVRLQNAIFESARVEGGSLVVADDSTFELAGDGEISGDVDLTGLVNITDECHVQAGALLRIDGSGFLTAAAGSIVTLGGTVTIQSGAAVTIASTAVDLSGIFNVVSGGRVDVEAGGQISVLSKPGAGGGITLTSLGGIFVAAGGEVVMAQASDLKVNAEAFTFRLTDGPSFISETVSGTPDWSPSVLGYASVTQHNTGGSSFAWYALPLRPGDSISSITVKIQGGFGITHASNPTLASMSLPIVQVISVDQDGVQAVRGTVVDPSTTASGYDVPHPVTLSPSDWNVGSSYLVVAGEALYVRVTGETGANAVADTTRVCSIVGSGTRRSVLGNGSVEILG